MRDTSGVFVTRSKNNTPPVKIATVTATIARYSATLRRRELCRRSVRGTERAATGTEQDTRPLTNVTRYSPLRAEAVQIAREERRLTHVGCVDQARHPALQPDGEATVRRQAVAKRLQEAPERRRAHASRFEGV